MSVPEEYIGKRFLIAVRSGNDKLHYTCNQMCFVDKHFMKFLDKFGLYIEINRDSIISIEELKGGRK